MALDLIAQDIIIDETTGLQDDDVSSSVPPHNNATVTYLLSLDSAGGLASPEVAFQANFVQATASAGETITSVVLAQNLAGTPFSTTVGVNSGIRTVDGNYVWLFQDATHANVVIGVIGTSDPAAEPVETGPLAFSFALINTSTTNADLYTVQYVPLLNPDAANPDDRIDLTDKVFASVSGTTVLNFSQLGDAPPGHNNWYILDADVASPQKILVTAHDNGVQAEVNVSTQGLGVASQDVRFGRELQIDLIIGGTQSAGKNFTDTPTAPDYDTHIETVSSAGFSVSQSTPTNTKADIEVHAYNNNDNAEGAAFPADDNDTEINITGATFKLNGVATTAAALGITVNLTGTGLILLNVGEGVTVDFTTAGGAGGTFDRFTIENIDTQHDFFDVKEVHFAGETTNALSEEVGSFINFDDDGPSINTQGTPAILTVDETDLTTNANADLSVNFTSAFGADGAGTLTYALSATAGPSGLTDTATGQAVNLSVVGGAVQGRTAVSDQLVFTVSVNAAGVVTLDQIRAVVHPNTNDPDDSTTLASAQLVQLTATKTDKDGDHVSATLNLGQNLVFEDDGPSINTQGTPAILTVDETDLTTNANADLSVNFTSAFGADGAGTLTYALSATAGPSGLTDTATGQAVNLSVVGGAVQGRTAVSDQLVFTVSVNAAGVVTLDQIRAVVHPNTNDPDDSTTLASAQLVQLTATKTDKDGDHVSATLNLGQNLVFEDDGPSINTQGTPAILTVDETDLTTNANADLSVNFTSAFGADGAGTLTYTLSATAGPSGLTDTATGQAVNLSVVGGVVQGRTAVSDQLVFTVSVNAAGVVTLDQIRAVVHPNTNDPDDSTTLASAQLVQLTATKTDKDGDHVSATLNLGQNLVFEDDGPSINTTGVPPTITVDETLLGTGNTGDFAPNFSKLFGADGAGTTTFSLGVSAGLIVGLTDTESGEGIDLQKNGDTVEGRTALGHILVFSVSVDALGVVTFNQARSITHADTSSPDDSRTLGAANLVSLTATVTDKDGDPDLATLNIGQSLVIKDDGPTVEVPVTYPNDPRTPEVDTQSLLGNAAGQTVSGQFGYDIGSDDHIAYVGNISDFVDADAGRAGVQLSLTGSVSATGAITNAHVDRVSEDTHTAVFNWTFDYDKDPNAAGVQLATATGTLSFDKDANTFTLTETGIVEGFSTTVLHTNELLAKAPSGNTGHPEIVVEQLAIDNAATPVDEDFYVQFTANSNPNGNPFGFNATGDGSPLAGDTTFNNGQFVTSNFEDWVSATQSTNGVAGDTIQKGELLTLRFFNSNILGDVAANVEKVDPTATADGVILKFDGIGNAEDLIMVLDLKDSVSGIETTRSVFVQNSDMIKGNANIPAPYNTEFTLDNNDALVILESNDFNAAGEHFEIQGVQIMQSGNGLAGQAINLNGAAGAAGGSAATSGLVAWEATDNDVLKIVDIGFLQTEAGAQTASLDFSFNIADGDQDLLGVHHINALISNAFIV